MSVHRQTYTMNKYKGCRVISIYRSLYGYIYTYLEFCLEFIDLLLSFIQFDDDFSLFILRHTQMRPLGIPVCL